jgi:hypothetical protein
MLLGSSVYGTAVYMCVIDASIGFVQHSLLYTGFVQRVDTSMPAGPR